MSLPRSSAREAFEALDATAAVLRTLGMLATPAYDSDTDAAWLSVTCTELVGDTVVRRSGGYRFTVDGAGYLAGQWAWNPDWPKAEVPIDANVFSGSANHVAVTIVRALLQFRLPDEA